MSRTAPLQVTQLEEREVPAAGMVADIHPGIWGSYPLNLTTSGNTLFFSADDGHGYELYATNGTAGTTHVVKDIKPGVGGSDPTNFFAAGNGIIYFFAYDGSSSTPDLWKSDGTAAGTAKVVGVSLNTVNMYEAVGLNGELYFLGVSAVGSSSIGWWKTNGTTTTLLKDFGPGSFGSYNLALQNGQVTVTSYVPNTGQVAAVWTTDGTAVVAKPLPQHLTATDPTTGTVTLAPVVELSPGKFLFSGLTKDSGGNTTANSLWFGDGQNPASRTLIATYSTPGASIYVSSVAVLGGKDYFYIDSGSWPRPSVVGLWVTDGTAAGTHKVDVLPGGQTPRYGIPVFNGQLLLSTPGIGLYGSRYWLSDGTAAGTHELTDPSGVGGQLLSYTMIPPSPGAPNGALLINSNGKLFRTDGTQAGTFWIDTTGLPTGFPTKGNLPPGAVFLNGSLYFSAANGDQRAELWKWDLVGQIPVDQLPPKVTSVVVNDGSAQRSMVTSLNITFDRGLAMDDGAISLKDAAGKAVLLYLTPAPSAVGETIMITFGTPGGVLPDGRYTLTVTAAKVHDAQTGVAMAADYTFGFTRLFGDLNGDGVYDREARVLVHNGLGSHFGDAGYVAALDVNRDGVIDSIDELAVVRNWGKSV
jgi:ELWxxDGT repeat protein